MGLELTSDKKMQTIAVSVLYLDDTIHTFNVEVINVLGDLRISVNP